MVCSNPNNQQQADKRIIGFDCEFVKPPPSEYIQSHCPVCLQIIREPHQVTCCGMKFCKACIEHIKAIKKPCPTCTDRSFSSFPTKGLKQSLYSLKVRCSHQKDGCEWTGELRQLDEHLNTDPQPEKQLDVVSLLRSLASIIAGTISSEGTFKTTKLRIAPNVHSVVSTAMITSLPMMMSPTTTGLCVGPSLSPALTSVVQLSSVRI